MNYDFYWRKIGKFFIKHPAWLNVFQNRKTQAFILEGLGKPNELGIFTHHGGVEI
jgi:hypothetical protein